MDKKELAQLINDREYCNKIFRDVRRAAIDADWLLSVVLLMT